ncbi:cytochrome P450 [Delitschia confertaspora ATCC 74209]|uniref:Cytochrome P450 n=1 Tax=Delitschia confertaspora ATCC 74209 TaxID=1513339 RepID=A0A9P4JQN0_9PLEO|nr:cytochrome P450 [Delitschia confertaspora ATCC 74209]
MWVTQALTGLLIAFAVAFLFNRLLSTKPDPREPPIVQPEIPFIGHIIGLLRHGAAYSHIVSARCNSPIFSLPMLNSRTYTVTSPHLASHVQRASTSLQFGPLIIPITQRMVGLSKDCMTKFEDANGEQEACPSFLDKLHEITYFNLSPPEIHNVSAIMLEQLTRRINAMGERTETGLFAWVREQFTAATTFAFYGPENPFILDPSLIEDFWTWEASMIAIMSSPFPYLTSPKAYRCRERVVKAMVSYFKNGRYKQADKLIQERHRLHSEYKISLEDTARSEVGLLFGILANGAVTTFWLLNNVFSRASLLSSIRSEIEQNAVSISPTSLDNYTNTISSKSLTSSCPLLNSAYRETLRLSAPMTSSRFVTSDALINNTYLLRKNSVVQIAGGVIHLDPSVWGPDAGEFNARRFLTSPYGTSTDNPASKTNVHPAAFRGFGGGSVFCPGRFFAQNEILSLVAGVVMGFDLVPQSVDGKIEFDSPKDEKRIPIGVMKPLKEIEVGLKRRQGVDVNLALVL